MKILNDIFSKEEVEMFRSYWNNNWEKHSYVNWEINGDVLDRRLLLTHSSREFNCMLEVVHQYFKDPVEVWSAYQRQKFAHQIHIDDYKKESSLPVYTIVFSMDTIPEFRTIVWKESAPNNAELQKHIAAWGSKRSAKISNISTTEDLEHTYDENQCDYFADYLNLDGIYSYQAGSGVLFNARQYHCTSNWKKYPQFTHRELLQVHVLAREPIDI